MNFEVADSSEGCLVLTCHGEASWEDREVLAAGVERHLETNPSLRGVVLDLHEVGFVNSAGLGAIFQLVQRLRGRGGQLVLARVQPPVERIFSAVGLDRVAVITEDVARGQAALRDVAAN